MWIPVGLVSLSWHGRALTVRSMTRPCLINHPEVGLAALMCIRRIWLTSGGGGPPVYLTSDDVMAATRSTMEDTIQYILDEYGSAAAYLHEVWSVLMHMTDGCAPA